MSQRTRRVAITNDELQQALTILLRAASSDGVTPLHSVARSASALLEAEAGMAMGRSSYVLSRLVQGGVIERINGTWRYQLLRGTLERNELDSLTLPERIHDAQQEHSIPGSVQESPDDIDRLTAELDGILEENRELTDENESLRDQNDTLIRDGRTQQDVSERDLRKMRLRAERAEQEYGTLHTQHTDLQRQFEDQRQAVAQAAQLVGEYQDLKSEKAKLEFNLKKLTKEKLQRGRERLQLIADREEAQRQATLSSRRADGLQEQIEILSETIAEHQDCIAGEAAQHLRAALACLQSQPTDSQRSVATAS